MNRKQLIRDAAVKLFAQKGFQATPTSEVAKLAGVSEGVIFYHFGTKEGILSDLLAEIMDEFIVGMREVLAKSPTGLEAALGCLQLNQSLAKGRSQQIMIVVRDLPVSFKEPSSPYWQVAMKRLKELLGLFQHALEMGIKDGSIRKCDPEKTAYVLLAMITGMSRMKLISAAPTPDLDQDYLVFCRKALAAD